jgi:hypothetical protein
MASRGGRLFHEWLRGQLRAIVAVVDVLPLPHLDLRGAQNSLQTWFGVVEIEGDSIAAGVGACCSVAILDDLLVFRVGRLLELVRFTWLSEPSGNGCLLIRFGFVDTHRGLPLLDGTFVMISIFLISLIFVMIFH